MIDISFWSRIQCFHFMNESRCGLMIFLVLAILVLWYRNSIALNMSGDRAQWKGKVWWSYEANGFGRH